MLYRICKTCEYSYPEAWLTMCLHCDSKLEDSESPILYTEEMLPNFESSTHSLVERRPDGLEGE